MKKTILSSLLFFAPTLAFALNQGSSIVSLSVNSFIAGKSQVVSIKNSSGVDVTAQYSLSYIDSDPAVTEIKVSAFAGKPLVQGVIAGQGYIIRLTNLSTSQATDIPVSVSPGPFYKLAIVSGNNQSVAAGSQASSPLVVQAQDLYKNGVAGENVTFTMPDKSTQLAVTDSTGTAQILYTASLKSGSDSVLASDGASSVSFSEKVVPGMNGVASVKLGTIPSSIDAGQLVSIPVSLTDSSGMAVLASVPVTFNVYKNNTCTSLDSNVPSQSAMSIAGSASFSFSDSVQELIYIGASAGGHSSCSSLITVSPPLGSVSKLMFTQKPLSGKSGVSLFPPAMIQLQDSNSRIVTSSNDNVTVNAYSDSSCSTSVPASGNSLNSVSGKAQFNSLKISFTGSAYIQAINGMVKSDCIGPISLTANTVVITPPPSSTFTITYASINSVTGTKGTLYLTESHNTPKDITKVEISIDGGKTVLTSALVNSSDISSSTGFGRQYKIDFNDPSMKIRGMDGLQATVKAYSGLEIGNSVTGNINAPQALASIWNGAVYLSVRAQLGNHAGDSSWVAPDLQVSKGITNMNFFSWSNALDGTTTTQDSIDPTYYVYDATLGADPTGDAAPGTYLTFFLFDDNASEWDNIQVNTMDNSHAYVEDYTKFIALYGFMNTMSIDSGTSFNVTMRFNWAYITSSIPTKVQIYRNAFCTRRAVSEDIPMTSDIWGRNLNEDHWGVSYTMYGSTTQLASDIANAMPSPSGTLYYILSNDDGSVTSDCSSMQAMSH